MSLRCDASLAESGHTGTPESAGATKCLLHSMRICFEIAEQALLYRRHAGVFHTLRNVTHRTPNFGPQSGAILLISPAACGRARFG